jgi:hypothetical protein
MTLEASLAMQRAPKFASDNARGPPALSSQWRDGLNLVWGTTCYWLPHGVESRFHACPPAASLEQLRAPSAEGSDKMRRIHPRRNHRSERGLI